MRASTWYDSAVIFAQANSISAESANQGSGYFRSIVFAPDLSGDIALVGYQRATVDNVIVSGANAVTGVNAQLVRDPSKIKFLPMVSRP